MTASTGTTARDAALPGAAARISPPTAPATTPGESAADRRAGPSRRGDRGCAAQPQPDQLTARGERRGLAEDRHRRRPRRHPIACRAAARARTRGRARAEAAQRFGRAQRVQQLGRLALIFLVARARWRRGHALQERLVRIASAARSALSAIRNGAAVGRSATSLVVVLSRRRPQRRTGSRGGRRCE